MTSNVITLATVLHWREIDMMGVVLAGLSAGYVMGLAGLWAGRVPGLMAVDIADFGRRYMVSDRTSAWVLGAVSHLANSLLLTLLWATVIEPLTDWPQWLEGLLWGEVLAVGFAGALVAPLAGQGLFGRRMNGVSFLATSLLMHAVWGTMIGLLASGPT